MTKGCEKSPDIRLRLADVEATLGLGRLLAGSLSPDRPFQCLLMQGGLGAGKTTLTRGLVESLPGGDQAEVASPSFNLLNLYPTRPPVAHFDLYRFEGLNPDESLLECLDRQDTLLIVEWSEHLPRRFWPAAYLLLRWHEIPEGRMLDISAVGEYTATFQDRIRCRVDGLRSG